jgi:superfamily I DNA/RNA helicase
MAKRKKASTAAQLDLLDAIEISSSTEEQLRFIEYDGKKSIILRATAGSGKTRSTTERLKSLLRRGVDPKRIIFFSFTKAATDELIKRINNSDIKVTTIHAFCLSILLRAGKKKDITNFFDFIEWYKASYKPHPQAKWQEKDEFRSSIAEMYENADLISGQISAFKLQRADGVRAKMPEYFLDYEKYQRERKARDFADMLIEVHEMFKEDKWLSIWKGKYDYIFVDEYQDTSTIQLRTLLALNARYYYLIGDPNQSIFGYSGANCAKLDTMLRERRDVEDMTLSINFRSDMSIVENSNNYSNLKATANSVDAGEVEFEVMTKVEQLKDVLDAHEEVAVLVRTNKVIKYMEEVFLKMKYPLRYFNFITPRDILHYKEGKVHPMLKHKLDSLVSKFGTYDAIIQFIEDNKDSKKFITSIHKSKGREFDVCVVVNSIAPEILDDNGFTLPDKQFKKVSFNYDDKDIEERNIHYVAVSRSRHKLYYMLYGNP